MAYCSLSGIILRGDDQGICGGVQILGLRLTINLENNVLLTKSSNKINDTNSYDIF